MPNESCAYNPEHSRTYNIGQVVRAESTLRFFDERGSDLNREQRSVFGGYSVHARKNAKSGQHIEFLSTAAHTTSER